MSPNTRRVRAVALELGIDYELVPMNVQKGDNRTPEFLAMNPNGKLPTLEDDGFVVWESNAIICYLAAKYGDGQLLPVDPAGRAIVDQWLYWLTSALGPAIGRVGFEVVLKPRFGLGEPDMGIVEKSTKDFQGLATILDRTLEGRAFITGTLSVADFSVAAMMDLALRAELSLAQQPNMRAWLDRIYALDSWKRSAPLH